MSNGHSDECDEIAQKAPQLGCGCHPQYKTGKYETTALIVADLRSEQWAQCSEEERDLLLELADRYERGEHLK